MALGGWDVPRDAATREMRMSFEGFGPQALPFFKALAFHQTREWFEENRETYEKAVKAPLGDLVEETASRLARAKIPLKGDRSRLCSGSTATCASPRTRTSIRPAPASR
jgi:hypothetical protein